MLRKAIPFLLAPTATDGGGGTATADPMLDSDPSAMSSWMTSLPSLDPAAPKKEPDGKASDNTGGSATTGVSAAPKSGDQSNSGHNAPAAAVKQPADASGKSAADDAAAKSEDAKAKEAALAAEKAAELAKAGEKQVDKPAEEKWPRSSADWDKYKRVHAEKEGKLQKEIETRQEKITALETQIAEFQKKSTDSNQPDPAIQAQLDSLKKENEEMSKRLQVVDVTQHPKFQAYFQNKVAAQKAMAKSILGDEGTNTAFEEIIALPSGKYKSEKLEEFVTNLPALQQIRIGAVLNSLEGIEAERAEEITKASTHKETLLGQQKAKQENSIKSRDNAINAYAAQLQKENPAWQLKKDDEAWNASVNERITAARKMLSGEGLKPQEIIKAAFDAAQLPVMLQSYRSDMAEKDSEISKLTDELKGLKEQVSKLTAVQPKLDGGGAANTGAEGASTSRKPTPGMNPQEAMDAFTGGLWKEG